MIKNEAYENQADQELPKDDKVKKKHDHNGHRKRVTDKISAFGPGILGDHELLEYILYSYYTRKNTNDIAHDIMNAFDNNWAQLLNASEKEIMAKTGATQNLAGFLISVGELSKRLLSEKINTKGLTFGNPLSKEARAYANSLFFQRVKTESLFVICIDAKNRLIASELIAEGDTISVKIDVRKMASAALETKATSIILAHNHPSGDTTPSMSDIVMTKEAYQAALAIHVRLVDHFIIGHAPEDCLCFAEKGIMARVQKEVDGKK